MTHALKRYMVVPFINRGGLPDAKMLDDLAGSWVRYEETSGLRRRHAKLLMAIANIECRCDVDEVCPRCQVLDEYEPGAAGKDVAP